MHSLSRRAFLRGRRLPQTPWEQFCQRLRRTVTGEFIEFDMDSTAKSGRLTAQHITDIHHVRALCREYGIVLALDGLSMSARYTDRPVVWVRPGQGMSGYRRIDTTRNRWFAQPGCTLGELRQAGLHQFDPLPPQMTVAAWIADRTVSDYPLGQTSCSGLEHACLLLGDGQTITLGPFATQNTKPLDGLRLQQLVPALFRLAAGVDVKACMDMGFWPYRYRLDAIMSTSGTSQNLAHFCLGHGGDLGWVEWVVIDADQLSLTSDQVECFSTDQVRQSALGDTVLSIDQRIKSLFDPDGVFSSLGQDL